MSEETSRSQSGTASKGTPHGRSGSPLAISARILALEVELRKVESDLLPRAFCIIGEDSRTLAAARDHCPSEVQEHARVSAEIDAIDQSLKERNASSSPRNTLAGKAVDAADEMQLRSTRDRLVREQAVLSSRIGRKMCQTGALDHGAFGPRVEEVARLESQAARLRDEIERLRRHAPWYAARPVWTVVVLLTATAVAYGSYVLWSSIQDRGLQRTIDASVEAAASSADRSGEIAASQAELAELLREETEHEQTETEAAVQGAALQELEEQKQGLIEQQRERENQAARDQDAQASLARLAGRTFADIDLDKAVRIASPRLRNFPVEIKGQDADAIRSQLASKDYLGLVGTLNGQRYREYPTAYAIEQARASFDAHEFRILLSTGTTVTRSPEGEQLVLVVFAPPRDLSMAQFYMIDVRTNWQPDPSGRGVFADWSPRQGTALIALLNMAALEEQATIFRDRTRDDLRAVQAQFELGEVSKEYAPELARRKIAENYEALFRWIASQP